MIRRSVGVTTSEVLVPVVIVAVGVPVGTLVPVLVDTIVIVVVGGSVGTLGVTVMESMHRYHRYNIDVFTTTKSIQQ